MFIFIHVCLQCEYCNPKTKPRPHPYSTYRAFEHTQKVYALTPVLRTVALKFVCVCMCVYIISMHIQTRAWIHNHMQYRV